MYESKQEIDKRLIQKAIEVSRMSQDPNTKVGAVLRVGESEYIGFNQLISNKFNWNREGDFLNTKYPFVIHAEADVIRRALYIPNAFFYKNKTIYTTLHPCYECAKLIAQFNIERVVYLDNKYKETYSVKAACMIFEASNIICEQIILI